MNVRFGMRTQLVVLFTVAFTVVFAAVFLWVYTFIEARTTERLRQDLNDTLTGVVAGLDGDEIAALYREGTPRADGFSDDPRYVKQMDFLKQVHKLEPRAQPYTMVRGDRDDTRRVGEHAKSPEFIYVVDIDIPGTPHAGFLEADTGSPAAIDAWNRGELTERPDLYTDKFGSWMSSYAPVKDKSGKVAALVGCDFEASYVERAKAHARNSVVKVLVATYVVMLLLVYFAAGFFTRPVRELTKATETLGEGKFESDIPLAKRRDELGALARAFNDMSARLKRAFHDSRARERSPRRARRAAHRGARRRAGKIREAPS